MLEELFELLQPPRAARRHVGIVKANHEGLTPTQETVTRDGKTFQETFWLKTGQEYSPERSDYQMQIAPPPE